MGYKASMEAAGATVHNYKAFGSYQGTWLALVTFNGVKGWIEGGYGSCSVCDAFQSEFGYCDKPVVGEDMWQDSTCGYRPATQEDVEEYDRRLADFGKGYLNRGFATQEEKVAEYQNKLEDEWHDSEDEQILAFIEENG